MFRFRPCLLCVLTVWVLALSSRLGATPPLTTISDTLFNANGTLFNGVVVISWPSFEASDTSNVAASSISVLISNGILYVQLVPTTNANTAAVYTVQYNSFGVTEYSQAWGVSPSTIPLRVRDVLLAPGSITGSAPVVTTILSIADITGLQNALNVRPSVGTGFAISRSAIIDSTGSIAGAMGNLSDCLHVDGTSAPCGTGSPSSPTFVDSEVPSGTLNGTNAAFILANSPTPPSSLALFRNGLLLSAGGDYTLLGNAITFTAGAQPQPGDILASSYRLAVSIPGVSFVDQETPSGTMDGVNAAFTLSQTPNPTTSLAVYRNGVRLTAGEDYTLSGATITFITGLQPQPGDILVCFYRDTQTQ